LTEQRRRGNEFVPWRNGKEHLKVQPGLVMGERTGKKKGDRPEVRSEGR